MDAVLRTPLVECFLRGDVARELRMVAARGVMADHAQDQLVLLLLLCRDEDSEVASTALDSASRLPKAQLAGYLARPEVPVELREGFKELVHGIVAAAGVGTDALPMDGAEDVPDPGAVSAGEAEPADEDTKRVAISSLTVVQRMKLAMRGTREQRAVLIRDPNRLVSAAVLGSPKLNETEVEAFARMGNVSEDVLRIIGSNRSWMKGYGVASALVKNPKTPPAIAMPLVSRLNERDLKALSTDRNVQEGIRLSARKLLTNAESRRR